MLNVNKVQKESIKEIKKGNEYLLITDHCILGQCDKRTLMVGVTKLLENCYNQKLLTSEELKAMINFVNKKSEKEEFKKELEKELNEKPRRGRKPKKEEK